MGVEEGQARLTGREVQEVRGLGKHGGALDRSSNLHPTQVKSSCLSFWSFGITYMGHDTWIPRHLLNGDEHVTRL